MLRKVRLNILLDYYEELLTPRQRKICRYYYRKDLSYQEIAELEHISRTAVYDMIRRSRIELEHYEQVLHLALLGEKRRNLYQKMLPLVQETRLQKLLEKCMLLEEGENYE